MNDLINVGEILPANLSPKTGAEVGKTRPVLIIQNQVLLNARHPLTIILPLSTILIDNAEPLRIRIKAQDKLEKDSDILIDHIRAIDNKRLSPRVLTKCSDDLMQEVYKALLSVLWSSKSSSY